MSEPAPIRVRSGVDRRTFESEIAPAAVPVVMQGLVAEWPSVRAARVSQQELARLLCTYDVGARPHLIEAPAHASGRIFYRDDLAGFNFTRAPAGIGATLQRLLQLADSPDAPALFLE